MNFQVREVITAFQEVPAASQEVTLESLLAGLFQTETETPRVVARAVALALPQPKALELSAQDDRVEMTSQSLQLAAGTRLVEVVTLT